MAGSRRTLMSVRRARIAAVLAAVLASSTLVVAAESQHAGAAPAAWTWVHQLGTPSTDVARAVALDRTRGIVYTVGSAIGTLPGSLNPNAGAEDAFVAAYTLAGRRVWVHELGTNSFDFANGVAVDAGGNVFVSGTAGGRMPGAPESYDGGATAFVAKYSPAGTRLWVHDLGSFDGARGGGVGVDGAGNSYLVGDTNGTVHGSAETQAGNGDVFIAKYGPMGNRIWVHQIGTASGETGANVAVDPSGNAYVTGNTAGTLPGSPESNAGAGDTFVAKYGPAGNRIWVHQLGAAGNDNEGGIALDGTGNVYVGGSTAGTLPGSADPGVGGSDAYIAKYSPAGLRIWVRQLGSANFDAGTGVGTDPAGNVYMTGLTQARLPGVPEAFGGGTDIFVAKFAAAGSLVSIHELGSWGQDVGFGVAADAAGNAYVVGGTDGTLPGSAEQNASFFAIDDAFVARLGSPLAPVAKASCTGTRGSIDSVLIDNGVGGRGLLYAKKSPQQFKLSASGQSCTGGLVNGARTKMTVTTATPVNCQTLPKTPVHAGVTLGGSGTFTWTAPDGMGTTNFNVQWLWTSNRSIHFSGSVSAAGSASNLFGGRHVSGNITTAQSLAAAAAGGNCTVTVPLTHFDVTRMSYTLS